MIVIDNFLNHEELTQVFNDFQLAIKSNRFAINKLSWQPLLYAGYDGSVYMHDLMPDCIDMIRKRLNEYVNTDDRTGMMHYLWDYKSGINWHHDDHCKWAATIYLSEEWHLDWGGHLMLKEAAGDKLVLPTFNRLVINTDQTEHKVTEVRKRGVPLRHTIQIFGK